MKTTLIQMDIAWADPAKNAETARKAILSNPGSDLYILPEMWSTGFATLPEGIAESDASESLKMMESLADSTGAAIAGSIAVKTTEDGSFRNRLYFVKPGGETAWYDKHHLFTYGGEHNHYTAGDERVIVEWKGTRFLLLVCYDLRFPLWARNHEDYDAIICVASWPTPRVEAWRTLLKARAIENQCYVCGVNRIGSDPSNEYCGGTAFVDPFGKSSECADGTAEALYGAIDMDSLQDFRRKFPVLKDRDRNQLTTKV